MSAKLMSAPVACEHRIARVVESVAIGRPVVLITDDEQGGHAELMLSAQLATTHAMSFLVRHSSGFVKVALPPLECDRLDLPSMPTATADRPAFTVSVDARENTGTGISAADRAETARQLSNPNSTSTSFSRPGHLVPLRTFPEASSVGSISLTLTQMAGLRAAAVLAEMVGIADQTRMADAEEAITFARDRDLAWLSSRDLDATDRFLGVEILPDSTASEVQSAVGALVRLPFRDSVSGETHSALFRGGDRSSLSAPMHVVAVRYEDPQWITLGLPWYVSGLPLVELLHRLTKEENGVVLFLRGKKSSPALERAAVKRLAMPDVWHSIEHAQTSRTDDQSG